MPLWTLFGKKNRRRKGMKKAPQPLTSEQQQKLFDEGEDAYQAGDYEKALRIWRPLADQGFSRALRGIGTMYLRGEGVEQNRIEAELCYQNAAKHDTSSMLILAEMYLDGTLSGTLEEALHLAERAKACGSSQAQEIIDRIRSAMLKKKPQPAVSQPASAGLQEKTAACQPKDAASPPSSAGLQEGMAARQSKDYAEALPLLEKAALEGNANAQYFCALMYYNGEGTAKNLRKALEWCEKAALQGHAEAQFFCGQMYGYGQGTTVDMQKAFCLLEKAAEQGHSEAQYFCGIMYCQGEGVPVDLMKSVQWLTKAAEQGNERAISLLNE